MDERRLPRRVSWTIAFATSLGLWFAIYEAVSRLVMGT